MQLVKNMNKQLTYKHAKSINKNEANGQELLHNKTIEFIVYAITMK